MYSEGEIILYQSEDSTQIEVRIEDEAVWLSLSQMNEICLNVINLLYPDTLEISLKKVNWRKKQLALFVNCFSRQTYNSLQF